MGLLNKVVKFDPADCGRVTSIEVKPVTVAPAEPVTVTPAEVLEPAKYGDLDFKRDGRGLIESISTTDQYGRKVNFAFKRNNMRVLEKISVKSGNRS